MEIKNLLLIVFLAGGIAVILYFLYRTKTAALEAPAPLAAPKKIELEKIFTTDTGCDECGLTTL